MTATFDIFTAPLDPDDQAAVYSVDFTLPPAVTIVSATVTPMDPTSTTPDSATDLVISNILTGQVSGNIWGVSFTPTLPGSALLAVYTLRLRVTTSASRFDYTCRLRAQQT